MKTLLWKELRENARWAALGLLLLALAELTVLSAARNITASYDGITLVNSTFLLVTSFGCALVGAGLAVAQILPERHRDQWAALLHRPVPRHRLFFGKVLPGLLLYLLATVTPFLASVAYVALPGQFAAPLVPGLLIPGLSDIFLGFTFYALTLLVCLQPGRWFGLRGVLALAALPIFVVHLAAPHPFLQSLGLTGILLLAAAGALSNGQRFAARHWSARLAFAAVVLVGAQTIFLLAGTALDWVPWGKPARTNTYTNYVITADGQVFLSVQSFGDSPTIVTDAEGQVVPDFSLQSYGGNLDLIPISWDVNKDRNFYTSLMNRFPRLMGNSLRPAGDDSQSPEIWYLLVSERYFVGYDRMSRRLAGICDREGFKPPGSAVVPFVILPEPSNYPFRDPLYFWSGPEARFFDARNRQYPLVFDAGTQMIAGIASLTPEPEAASYAAIGLSGGVQIVTEAGEPALQIPYGHDTNIRPTVSIAVTDDLKRVFIQYQPMRSWRADPGEKTRVLPVFLDELDREGRLIRTHQAVFSNVHRTPPTWGSQFRMLTGPLLPSALATTYRQIVPDDTAGLGLPTSWIDVALVRTPTDLAVITGLGLVFAAGAFGWARRRFVPARRAAWWAVFVFAFGPAGFIAFRLLSRWPVVHRCPACARHRPLESQTCPHCQAAWPPPSANHTEILETA